MTIAAGFSHGSGIVLCADTQQEAGTGKFHGPKVGVSDIPYGKIAFAMAGNAAFATTAVQSCAAALGTTTPSKTISVMVEVLESEYRRLVFTHPLYTTDPNLWYAIIIALWQESTKTCSLWVTQEHSIHSCFEHFCAVGAGTDLANVIVRPFADDALTEQRTLTLMAYMMARVKDNVAGCGGISQYISLSDDGACSSLINISLDEVEKVAALYDKAVHELLLFINEDDYEAFSRGLTHFGYQAHALRDNWSRIRRTNPEVRRFLGLTKDERSRQRPSPESPEESGES
jgi:hypothetical protein